MSRVALSGSSGTGKTTLLSFIREAHGLQPNPVGSRSVSLAMGFASPYDVDAAGRRAEFQRRLLAEKIAWEAVNESFVTDRTTADNLAYLALHDCRAIDDALLDAVRESLRRYTLIFYCPVSAFCAPGDDPARVADLAYQWVYDAALFGLLQRLAGASIVTLGSGDLAQRKRIVADMIRADRGSER